MLRPSHPARGADRESSRTWCGMRWTRRCWQTNSTCAYGEAVWSWRAYAGAKFARSFALTTVANAGSPRRARNKPSNHRAGKAGYLGCYLWSTRLAQLFLRGGPGYQPVPGLPCALPISRAKLPQSLGRERAAGRSLMSRRWCRWSCPRRRASSIPEASQLGLRRLWNTGSSGQAGR